MPGLYLLLAVWPGDFPLPLRLRVAFFFARAVWAGLEGLEVELEGPATGPAARGLLAAGVGT